MTHRTRLDVDPFYVDGVDLPAAWWNSLDAAQAASINGDAGGTWNPASAITVGGAGVWLCGPSNYNFGSAAAPALSFSSSNPLVHGDSDYIQFGTPISRTIVTSCDLGVDASGGLALMVLDAATDGVVNLATTASSYRAGGRLLVPLSVHNGATLASAVFAFIIASGHGGLPSSLAQVRLFAVDILGNVTPLYTGGPPGIGAGFIPLTAANVGAYEALTSFTYTCDSGVIVDTSKYSYFAEIVDESGTNARPGNKWESITCSLTSIADLRFQ